jgi:NifU-like protein involved in Fe-S cluster formation
MNDADPRYSGEVRRRMATLAGEAQPGAVAGAGTVTGRAGDREQGAEVCLHLRLAGGRIAEARYRAFGCPHLIAAAAWLTERLAGCGRVDLEQWDWREAAAALEVPPAKFGRLLTLQDAVRDAAGNWPGDAASTV